MGDYQRGFIKLQENIRAFPQSLFSQIGKNVRVYIAKNPKIKTILTFFKSQNNTDLFLDLQFGRKEIFFLSILPGKSQRKCQILLDFDLPFSEGKKKTKKKSHPEHLFHSILQRAVVSRSSFVRILDRFGANPSTRNREKSVGFSWIAPI